MQELPKPSRALTTRSTATDVMQQVDAMLSFLLGRVFAAAALPSPLHPIRAAVPQLGVRPFLIESAWRSAAVQLRCVVSALRARSPDAPAACEVYVISLDTANLGGSTGGATDEAGDAVSPALRVSDICLLQASTAWSPPACEPAAKSLI